MVESQPSKLLVAGSIPVSRSRKSTLTITPVPDLLRFRYYTRRKAFSAE